MSDTDRTTDGDSDTESNSGIATENGIDTIVTDQSLGQPDTDAEEKTGTSVGRRSVLAGLAGLGLLGTAAGSARAASTPLEFGGNYTGDPGADWGLRLDPSNARFGLLGFSAASNGRGVVGRATSNSGETIGVIGRSDSSSDGAAGLMGFNDATTGRTYGFKGRSDSTDGRGALGIATADTGDTIGLEGRADSPSGVAVSGTNTAPSGVSIGVQGQVNSPYGFGLYTPDNARIEGFLHVVELGAVDPTPITIVSDEKAVLRLTPEVLGAAGNVLAGHSSNATGAGVVGAVVAGGGFDDGATNQPNRVLADFGAIGGGLNNTVHDNYGSIGGGARNTVGLDDGDPTAARGATVGGGTGNVASGLLSIVAGGDFNAVSGAWASIGGGLGQRVAGDWGTVAGGEDNWATASHATVGGGQENHGDGQWSTVGGGRYNEVQAKFATVSGGGPSADWTTRNMVHDDYGTIGGGGGNRAGTDDADPTNAVFATVGGGQDNAASSDHATVAGGVNNSATSWRATVSGGDSNTASGHYGTVPGGFQNTAAGLLSFAAGRGAWAGHDGSFVWADSLGQYFDSNGADTWSARCRGGARFVTATDADGNPTAGSELPAGSGTWSALSARAAKTDVRPVDPAAVLDGVLDLDVNTWQYTAETGVQHMGPMAEDFHDAFGLGPDDEHITTVDADGVAFAAIQGLAEKLDGAEQKLAEKDDRIDDLEAENEALRGRNDDLETRLEAVENHLGLAGASDPSPPTED
jgi:hypothetical protein